MEVLKKCGNVALKDMVSGQMGVDWAWAADLCGLFQP